MAGLPAIAQITPRQRENVARWAVDGDGRGTPMGPEAYTSSLRYQSSSFLPKCVRSSIPSSCESTPGTQSQMSV